MKKNIPTALVLAFAIALGAFWHSAQAASPLSGWAWSSNIGWISFNSTNVGAGSGPAYSVQVSTTTGSTVATFSGYAWSPNIGWISFNAADSAGCSDPAGATTGSARATVDASGKLTGRLDGFAMALSSKGRTDGWNGCISLSGTNHLSPTTGTFSAGGRDYIKGGVTYFEQIFNGTLTGFLRGFAWSPSVIGWLSFEPNLPSGTAVRIGTVVVGGGPTASCTVGGSTNPVNLSSSGGAVVFSYSNSAAGSGDIVTYQWKPLGSGAVSGANPFSHSYPSNSGSSAQEYYPSVTATRNGTAESPTACPIVKVAASLGASSGLKLMVARDDETIVSAASDYDDLPTGPYKARTIRPTQEFQLKWNVDPAAGFDSCNMFTSAGVWPFGGSLTPSSAEINNISPGTNRGQYTIEIECSGPGSLSAASIVNLNIRSGSVQEI